MKKFTEYLMSQPFIPQYINSSRKSYAFTMAEILISLTIIGVIAAITLPALRTNIDESTWSAQRKALHTRMSQALSMMGSLNGYGVGSTYNDTQNNAAMAFVRDGLSKVIKINNICNKDNLSKCGIPDKIITMADSRISFPTEYSHLCPYEPYNSSTILNTNAAAFETVNGESVAVFYNPSCKLSIEKKALIFRYVCANFIYDLNGKKTPNKVGEDIGFITALYPINPYIVAPMPLEKNANNNNTLTFAQAAAACETQDENSRMPNIEELFSIYTNQTLINMPKGEGGFPDGAYWSSSTVPSYTFSGQDEDKSYAWGILVPSHQLAPYDTEYTIRVRCVKR